MNCRLKPGILRVKCEFIQAISIAPLQVLYYSEALPTQPDTVPEFHAEAPLATVSEELALRGGWSGSRTRDPSDERRRLNQSALTPHRIHVLYCIYTFV